MNKVHSKTLVFDFDDTISFTKNRDWENAEPNLPLIQKIQELYTKGWKIIIATSRGNLSCATRQEAAEKYGPQITEWLNKHHVPFDELSFEKKLGVFYIDDKALRPDEFVEMNIREIDSKGSWTDGKFDHIEDEYAHDTIKWYQNAKSIGLNVPHVNSVTGKNITREHLTDEGNFILRLEREYVNGNYNEFIGRLKDCFKRIKKSSLSRPKYSNASFIDDFCNEIRKHDDELARDLAWVYGKCIRSTISSNVNAFYHGNLVVDNLTIVDNKIYFSNPVLINGYMFPVMELATLLASIKIKSEKLTYVKNFLTEEVFNELKEDFFSIIKDELQGNMSFFDLFYKAALIKLQNA